MPLARALLMASASGSVESGDASPVTKFPTATSTVVNPDTGAGVVWGTPENIYADDTSYASALSASGANARTKYLNGQTYGFDIATGHTIDGIEVKFGAFADAGNISEPQYVRLTKDGSTMTGSASDPGTVSATNPITPNPTNLQSSLAEYVYGSATDLWGTTWTAEEINAATFGAGITCVRLSGTDTNRLDYITITVYHH